MVLGWLPSIKKFCNLNDQIVATCAETPDPETKADASGNDIASNRQSRLNSQRRMGKSVTEFIQVKI